MIGFAGEVLDALHSAVVLAFGHEEFDADPFSRRERCCAKETNDASASRYLYDCPECDHGRRHVGIRPRAVERAACFNDPALSVFLAGGTDGHTI